MAQNLQDAAKAVLKGKFIVDTNLLQKARKSQKNNLKKKERKKQPNLTPKGARKRTNKIQKQQKEGNNKD